MPYNKYNCYFLVTLVIFYFLVDDKLANGYLLFSEKLISYPLLICKTFNGYLLFSQWLNCYPMKIWKTYSTYRRRGYDFLGMSTSHNLGFRDYRRYRGRAYLSMIYRQQ